MTPAESWLFVCVTCLLALVLVSIGWLAWEGLKHSIKATASAEKKKRRIQDA